MATSQFNMSSTNDTTTTNPTVVLDDSTIGEINHYYKHLQANLVLMSTKASVMNRQFAVSVLGFKVKWVRSFYLLSRREILIDFVPKGSQEIQASFIQAVIEQKSGYHNYQGQLWSVKCQIAKTHLNINELYDYASLLSKGQVIHHMYHPDRLVPNQDWEPPQHMIPRVELQAGIHMDPQISANARRSDLLFKTQVLPATAFNPAKEVVIFYKNKGTYNLF